MIPVSPVDPLGNPVAGLAAEAWTAAMLGLWNAGLWLLTVVLQLEDALLTPDLREDGPAGEAYAFTFWLAAALMGVMLVVQLAVTLIRRDGRGLAAALWGCGKFVVVWAGWLAWGVAVVSACGGLTRALLRSLLGVDGWGQWKPGVELDLVEATTDATVATVLGLLGLVLWVAALGHVLVMITRAGTLIVLAAVTPVAAAGLVGEAGRGWFWKSVRWFHAAALTPVLMALLLGVGVQTTAGVAEGLAAGPGKAIGTALPGVLLILMSCFAPVALFKLLAFVDPATPTGAAMRQAVDSVLQAKMLIGFPAGQAAAQPDAWSGSGSDDSDARRAAAQDNLGSPDRSTEDAGSGSGAAAQRAEDGSTSAARPAVPANAGSEAGPSGIGGSTANQTASTPSDPSATPTRSDRSGGPTNSGGDAGVGARGAAAPSGAAGVGGAGGAAAAVPVVPV